MSESLYHSYNQYLQSTLGAKTYKVVVSSGLTCPTRDGTLSKKACAFCDLRGSSSFHAKQGRGKGVQEQLSQRLPQIKARFKAEKFLAYFQSYTNTYSDVSYLREIYEAALASPEISGLCIGTRPDCLPEPVVALLEELAQKHYVSLELGVQSFEDPTLLWLERGHDGRCSIEALEMLAKKAPSVHTCVHLIFGSPTDTPEMARQAALHLNRLAVKGVKLHQLMVLEHTELAERYRQSPFPTLDLEPYTQVVAEFLSWLSPAIYVERLCATATHPEECLAPEWSRKRWEPHNEMRRLLTEWKIQQGQRLLLS